MTFVVAYCSPTQGTITDANAGHSVVIYVPAGGTASIVEATGFPFGIFDETDFGEETLSMGPGDLLVISSDGFAEAHNLSLLHISEPTRQYQISYAVFCLKKNRHSSAFPYSHTLNYLQLWLFIPYSPT